MSSTSPASVSRSEPSRYPETSAVSVSPVPVFSCLSSCPGSFVVSSAPALVMPRPLLSNPRLSPRYIYMFRMFVPPGPVLMLGVMFLHHVLLLHSLFLLLVFGTVPLLFLRFARCLLFLCLVWCSLFFLLCFLNRLVSLCLLYPSCVNFVFRSFLVAFWWRT